MSCGQVILKISAYALPQLNGQILHYGNTRATLNRAHAREVVEHEFEAAFGAAPLSHGAALDWLARGAVVARSGMSTGVPAASWRGPGGREGGSRVACAARRLEGRAGGKAPTGPFSVPCRGLYCGASLPRLPSCARAVISESQTELSEEEPKMALPALG